MSTTAPSSTHNASGNSQAGATKSTAEKSQRSGQTAQTPADLFANLLGLLSATSDATLNADGTEAATLPLEAADPELPTDNPLAALLAWPGAPVLEAAPTQGAEKALIDTGKGIDVGNGNGNSYGQGALTTTAQGSDAETQDLHGMTVLDQPVQADAELLASVEAQKNEPVEQRSPARSDASAFASRPANWRSTTALAHSAASVSPSNAPTSTQQIQLGQAAQVRMGVETSAPASRSTLTLDERFSASSLSEGSTTLAGLSPHGQANAQGGFDQSSPGSGAFAEALNTERAEVGADELEFTLAPENADEAALPEEAAPNANQLRHASLRIGEGAEEAIDIQLALRGEQLNVDFRTDNPEARASLQNNASSTLGDLLQRSGIQLGQVSVGAQQSNQDRQGQGQDSASNRSSVSGASRRVGATGADRVGDDAAQPQPPSLRKDGSRPLDLFV